ncbi:unnamed protein product [Euphydryas editha]|uniref:Uncharacterized protein n=1 Tax=Euphydryas editha TaxID=104508 RepID=A0AAU9UP24_EUPED|nr:unnamed protein product [Euphydryas editha]
MADIGHSRILKYIVDTSKMTDKVETLESKVPGEQQLRVSNSNEIALSDNEKNDGHVYTTVLNMTKEETTWTKGGVKLQKVVVSEDATVRYQHRIVKNPLDKLLIQQ